MTSTILTAILSIVMAQHVVVPLDGLPSAADEADAPPVSVAVDSMAASVVPGDEAVVRLVWTIRVLEDGWVDLPVTRSELALTRATLDGAPVALAPDDQGVRRLTMELAEGSYRLAVRGTVATPSSHLQLPVLTAARQRVDVPGDAWDVTVEGGIREDGSRFDLADADTLVMDWKPSAPEAPRPTVVTAETLVGLRVDGGGIEGQAAMTYKIRYGTVDSLTFRLPGNLDSLEVTGSAVARHERHGEQVVVFLGRPSRGVVRLLLAYRAPPPEGDAAVIVPIPVAVSAEGYVNVLRGDESIVVPDAGDGLDAIPASALPARVLGLAEGKNVAAYRLEGRNPRLSCRLVKYEPLDEPPTLIDEARYEVAYSSPGRLVLKARYQVRNDRNQYLHVTPPEGLTLMGARVAGVMVQPVSDSGQGFYIPLEKSVESLTGLVTFPVEVLFWGKQASWDRSGRRTIRTPAVDAPVAYARWEVILPPELTAKTTRGTPTQVERWTDRDKGLTYGHTYGDVLTDEGVELPPAKDSKKRVIKTVQSRSGPATNRRSGRSAQAAGKGGGKFSRSVRIVGGSAPPPPPAEALVADPKPIEEDLSVEMWNMAYRAYQDNRFDEADRYLDQSLELDPGNKAAAALQGNVDLLLSDWETGEEDEEEEVMERRVREMAQAKTQTTVVKQEKLKKKAEEKLRAGDMEAAQRSYKELVEVTEELARVEQAENMEQKSSLEDYSRQLAEIEQQVEELKDDIFSSKASLMVVDELGLVGSYDEPSSGEAESIAGLYTREQLIAPSDDDSPPPVEPESEVRSMTVNPLVTPPVDFIPRTEIDFSDVVVDGQLQVPAGAHSLELESRWHDSTEGTGRAYESIVIVDGEPIVGGEDYDGFEDEDGIPDLDMDGDSFIDTDDRYSDDRYSDDHGRDYDRGEANDVEKAIAEVPAAPPPASVKTTSSDRRRARRGGGGWAPPAGLKGRAGSSSRTSSSTEGRNKNKADKEKVPVVTGAFDMQYGTALAGVNRQPSTAGKTTRELLDLPTDITASPLSLDVPRAGESLRFEQRLVEENTPLTVDIAYRTRPKDRRK